MATIQPQAVHSELSKLFAAPVRTLTSPPFIPSLNTNPDFVTFAYGLPDPALFPAQALAHAAEALLANDATNTLSYGPTDPRLIQVILDRLHMQGIAAQPEEIIVSYGSSQLLALLPQILVDPGDVLIVEEPTFIGAVDRFIKAGARLVTVPLDEQGMDIDVLETRLIELRQQGIRPKFIYTMPNFHNPAGVTMSLPRRHALVELATTYGVLIVEDDAYGDLRFHGKPLPTLAALDRAGWVIYVSTFSKILAPGIRIGWAYAPQPVIERLNMVKEEADTGPFVTALVGRYSADGHLDPHIQTLIAAYRQKCETMLQAIASAFPADVVVARPDGGFFIWCKLPEDMRASALLSLAVAHGVDFLPGTRCFADGRGDDAIRLAFSLPSIEQINRGIVRLGKAMWQLRGR